MSEPECPQKAPYVIDEQPGDRFWCACGRSSSQPYCDGSHAGTGIAPVRVAIPEAKKVAWCGCKRSGRAPYCDGAHRNL